MIQDRMPRRAPFCSLKKEAFIMKILLADDSKTQREIVAAFLSEEGFDVSTASDGREVMEALERDRPELLILDIVMPEVDGYTVLRELKKNNLKVPVIIVSRKEKEAMEDLLYFEDYAYYLQKPFRPQELLEKIKNIERTRKGQ
jgi:DNA-binding response OmpR family regulator